MRKIFTVVSLLTLASLFLAACAPQATQAPAVQTVVVTVLATEPPTTAPTAPPPAATPVAQVPADALSQKGKLLICSDLPYPPMEFFDENGNPTGSDIEMGTEIANRLGLQVQIVNSVFDTIIAAVTSGKCDIIISDQNITADRQKQVSMIPYFQAGQSMLAAKGNPLNINVPTDLCGQSVAAESGTTEVDYLQGTGDFKGKGLPADCTKAGKPAPKVVVTQKDTDALQQLQAGKVAVYFADTPVAAYYTVQHPDQFQLVGQVIEPAMVGISVPCGQADCTNAPLSPLGQAVQTALKSMIADGTYGKILDKWNLASGAIK
jgi:polar amino acid transport system substrate-binding protein